jgi:hypothetical protein
MSVLEFKERLTKTNDEITKLTSVLEESKARKVQWLTAAKPARDLKALNEELRVGQQSLEDLAITKAALEGKLRIYAQNEPAAADKRKEVIAADERCREHVEALIKLQQETRPHIEAVLMENAAIGRLDEEHLALVGERMNIPHIAVPYQASNFAGSNVPPIQPLRPWQYASEEERTIIRKQELEKKLEQHEARIEIAEEHAPLCPQCLLGNIETKMKVNRRAGRDDAPGQSITRHHWSLKCPRCSASQTVAVPETK